MTDFAEFWSLASRWRGRYSNPRGRVASPGKPEIRGAEPSWYKCIKEGADPERMYLGACGYVAHIAEDDVDPQHVCQAVTFLNQWRWEQYVEIARETEEREAAELLERRRAYYRYGRRDFLNDDHHQTDIPEPEVQAAYDMGWCDAEKQAAPKLSLVR